MIAQVMASEIETELVSVVKAMRWPKTSRPIAPAIGPIAASGRMYLPQIAPGFVNSDSTSLNVVRGSNRTERARLAIVSIEVSPQGRPPR